MMSSSRYWAGVAISDTPFESTDGVQQLPGEATIQLVSATHPEQPASKSPLILNNGVPVRIAATAHADGAGWQPTGVAARFAFAFEVLAKLADDGTLQLMRHSNELGIE
jgi:hypothetical protein